MSELLEDDNVVMAAPEADNGARSRTNTSLSEMTDEEELQLIND